ncbi:pheromone-processing carboxypeptidase KEX1-like [Solanum pennellii]|uniref:Pheromone-processing carboxypeptidase KEX1-like n=1 Tax=Solanum pennellii TaxID=28526 RepID=A0ABM1VC71_SOLPN|nr:pheromone-processing carboxypeptidase KEX1-like [Solanum pennellii]
MVDGIGSYEDTDMYMECDIPRHVKGPDNIEDDDDDDDDDNEDDEEEEDDDDEYAEDYDGEREEEEKPEKKVTFVFPASTTIFLAAQIPLP